MVITAIVLIITVMYFIMLLRIKANANKYNAQQFNLSVPSYQPVKKAGKYSVRLESSGPDPKATLQIINRFREQPLMHLIVGEIVADNLNIYTAEDLVEELAYIGAISEVVS